MKTTYVFNGTAVIEKSSAMSPPNHRTQVISDIPPFQTIDGTVIGSRMALREYERIHGVRQVGNDWTGSTKPTWYDSWRAREKAKGR